MNKIYLLKLLLSYLPILNIGDDNEFGDLVKDSKNLRYSLIAIRLGHVILYIFTIKNWQFKFFNLLKLEQVLKDYKPNLESINRYKNKTETSQSGELNLEIDVLKFKIKEQEHRNDSTITKAWIYNAALMVFIPLGLPYIVKLYNIRPVPFMITILWTCFVYISALILSIHILRIRSSSTVEFAPIAKSSLPVAEYAYQMYSLYQHSKTDSDKLVSYNTNLQRDIRLLLYLLFLIVVYLNISGLYSKITSLQTGPAPTSIYQSFSIDIKGNTRYSLKTLNKVEQVILEGKISRIIIVGNAQDVKRVLSILGEYNISNTPICTTTDNNQSSQIDIILRSDR